MWKNRKTRLFTLILCGVLLLAGGMLFLHRWLFVDLPDVGDFSASLRVPSVRITDRQGRLLYEVIGDEAGRHNVVSLDDIPDACIDATIATEDANFYTNPGVDIRAIARSVWINLQGGEVLTGASTITQQVARNLLLSPEERAERSLQRKLREAILAYRLSRGYDKDDILALYLNQTYYGNLAYGIDAAARAYFGKPVSSLDLAECALLAGLPQAPAVYDPLTDPEAAQERQAVVLGLMARHSTIDAEQASLATAEQLVFAAERYTIEAPHFVMAVYDQLETRLPPDVFQAGGLEVTTTLDVDWQHAAEEIIQRHLAELNEPQGDEPPHNAHNAALVALDPYTGQVRAMVGSPDYFDASISGAIDMALTPRQPGSTLKPFTYAIAFDPTRDSPWTPATMLLDVQTSFVTREGFAYTPTNYDLQEHGPVLVREALASSYNIPAVIALDEVGVDSLLRLVSQLGLTTFPDPSRYDLALTLGGGEVRLLELSAAYAAFANGGDFVSPVLVTEVRDADGQVVYSQDSGRGERIVDPGVAWLITDILSDNLARAPAFTTHSVLQIGRPAAVKTGTTTNFRDNWTVGYTPNLVVGVWVGNANNAAMVNVSGVSGAGPIWHQFMRTVLRGQPELVFEQPDGLIQAEVCSLSGLLPAPDCPHTQQEWFIIGTVPTEEDTFYQLVVFDAATGLLADDGTPSDRRQEVLVLDLPPEAHDWARNQGLRLLVDMPVPGESGQLAASASTPLIITSPEAHTIFRIDPGLPLDSQRIRVSAAGAAGLHDVTLHMDGIPLDTLSSPPFEAWWMLSAGEHEVSAAGFTLQGDPVTSPTITFSVRPAQ